MATCSGESQQTQTCLVIKVNITNTGAGRHHVPSDQCNEQSTELFHTVHGQASGLESGHEETSMTDNEGDPTQGRPIL